MVHINRRLGLPSRKHLCCAAPCVRCCHCFLHHVSAATSGYSSRSWCLSTPHATGNPVHHSSGLCLTSRAPRPRCFCFVSPRLNPPPLHPDAPPPPAPFAHLLLHVHGPCCTDVPSPCLEMSSLHRPTHHRRLMCPMSALMRSAAAGSIRAGWSLQHGTVMDQACGEGANRGVHQGRVAVSTCHATELPVLEWPSAGQHQHTQTTKKTLETV